VHLWPGNQLDCDFSSFPVGIAWKLMHFGHFDIKFVVRVGTIAKEA
jgi:hypothetical protein